MMKKYFILIFIGISFILSGCFQMEGQPPSTYSKVPYGAYFVKPGMTREIRLRDFAACGAHDGLGVGFTKEEMDQAEKMSKATGEFIPGKNNDGFIILRRRFESCMVSRGYQKVELGKCEGNQQYQSRCMWP